MKLALICGLLGCVCIGAGDWLMLYADASFEGSLKWLTAGAAQLPQWRFNLAMLLAFPGVILYGIALFAIQNYIKEDKHRNVYHYLNAFGLTPWLALHLFYIMVLSLFAWMNQNGYAADSLKICEALAGNLLWVVPVSEVIMIPVFVYWFYLQITGKTVLSKSGAFCSVLVIFVILEILVQFMPASAFKLGFTNGLMSESMFIWFCGLLAMGSKSDA